MRNTTIAIAVLSAATLGLAGCDVEKTAEGKIEAPKYEVTKKQDGEVKLPEYNVRTPDVDVSTKERTVTVPDVDVNVNKRQETVKVPDIDVKPAPNVDDQRSMGNR